MLHLDYRDARPIYSQIVFGITEQIRTGILRPGDKLQSVRELEAAGWIATVPGKGCFVCAQADNPLPGRQELLDEFDRITAALLLSGVSREDLAAMILQGGNDHA